MKRNLLPIFPIVALLVIYLVSHGQLVSVRSQRDAVIRDFKSLCNSFNSLNESFHKVTGGAYEPLNCEVL